MIRLDNSGDLLSTLGVSLLSFASLSLLLNNSCPFVIHTENENENERQKVCPLNSATRGGFLLGAASVGLGSTLQLASQLRD